MSTLAPWLAQQARQLLAQRGHAWLLAGPAGMGQIELALALARAWLCEQPAADGACGACASCHAMDVRAHADLCVLMPETALLALGWPLGEKAQDEIDGKKRKPSREIRVEAMREAVEFAQRTSARGRGKVVLVFPAERMNVFTANALLKTLEEPAGDVRFVLASEAVHQVLPTIRSRCLAHTLHWCELAQALDWLQAQGIAPEPARVALRAAGGRPLAALEFVALTEVWGRLPKAVSRGDVGVFKDWSAPQVVDALQKLCHDALVVASGGAPRYFLAVELPRGGSLAGLGAWAKALARLRRHVDHPFNQGLMLEALVSQAQLALNSAA